MIILFGLSCFLGALLVSLTYILKSRHLIQNETARKLIHFAHALTVAGWPVFIGYWFVILAEILFLAVVLAAQEYKLFHSLRKIDRKTWGEFFFPIGVITLALIAPSTWVFASSLILLGLADGTAAIIGKRAKKYNYKLFGHKKSLAGTVSFYLVAQLVIIVTIAAVSDQLLPSQVWAAIVTIPLLTTFVENVSPYGSDNFTVPLAVYLGLLATGVI